MFGKNNTLKKLVLGSMFSLFFSSSFSQYNNYFFKSTFDSVPNIKTERFVKDFLARYNDPNYQVSETTKGPLYFGLSTFNYSGDEIKFDLIDKDHDGWVEHLTITDFKKGSVIEYIDSNKDKVFDIVRIDLYNDKQIINIQDSNYDGIIDAIK